MYALKQNDTYGILPEDPFLPWQWPVPKDGLIGKKGMGRMDGYEKATGKGLFTRDIHVNGMVYAKLLLSPYAHAKIKSIDDNKARALPGVIDIIRYDDEGMPWFLSRRIYFLGDTAYHHPCAVGAMVVAETEAICDRALRLLEVEWEEQPFILDWHEALEDGASLTRPDLNAENNIHVQKPTVIGDVEAGLAESDNIIEFTVEAEEDAPIGPEPLSFVASPRGEQVDIWYHGQCQQMVHESLATLRNYTGWGMDKIRCFYPFNGGTWGAGGAWHTEIARLALIAAKRNNKPVKLVCDNESLMQRPGERAGSFQYTIGYNDDGIINAVKLKSVYNSDFGDQVNKIDKCTKIPNIYCLDVKPYLNRGPYACFKHGLEACSVVHMVFGHVAAALNMDPTQLAILNDGSYQHDWDWIKENVKKPLGFPMDRDSLKECIQAGKQAIDWDNKIHEPGAKILPNGNYHGIGFVWTLGWQNAGMRRASIGFYINWDGTLNVQGTRAVVGVNGETTYAMVIASELGIKFEDISFQRHDSLFAQASAGNSENMNNNVAWAVRASKKMKQLLLEAAIKPGVPGWAGPPPAFFPDKSVDDLDIKDSFVFEKANPENKVTIRQIVQAHSYTAGPEGAFGTPFFVRDLNPVSPEKFYQMNRQVYFTEVEVNPDTGQVFVTNVATVYDGGTVINPDSFEGQQYGGMYMGYGRSNAEEVIYDYGTGRRLNDNLIGYPVYLMNDVGSMDCRYIETKLGWGPYGACGCSEAPAATPGGGATNVAIYNAIGKWVNHFPTTPDQVLKALGKA
ncbi:MAG: molybdopterin-dependent oxidoreductase [Dehalococcoidales bacterium]|nr:molybdopterin-dependent oxidoreductase [Dehalococcoidales bacterium]